MPVRGQAFSLIEEKFLLKALEDNVRVDQRKMCESRNIKVSYGIDYGCCTADLGRTKVMAQVACVLDRPKESRPNEGRLNVNVELSTIAFPTFDPAKPGNLGISIQRMLEKSFLLSRAVDLEELCIRAGEKVWNIQVYIHVLAYDGNIMDCTFIAAICALKHFRRSDVSVIGQEVIVHSLEEKNPIPLTLHHLPLCVSFAFFNGCADMVVDPTYHEEKVMDGVMMIAMNKHKELCCLLMNGQMKVTREQILQCTSIAAVKVKELVSFVTKSLENDVAEKKGGKTFSYFEFQNKERNVKTKLHKNEIQSVGINIGNLSVNDLKSQDEDNNNKKLMPSSSASHWMSNVMEKSVSVGESILSSGIDGCSAGHVTADKTQEESDPCNSDSEDEVEILNSNAIEE